MKHFYLILFSISLIHTCTIGGAYDDIGRPYIFKTRYRVDIEHRDKKMYYNTDGEINFIGNISVGDDTNETWMGLNEEGLSIVNAWITDNRELSRNNGRLMLDVLSQCADLDYFTNTIVSNITDSYSDLSGIFLLSDNTAHNESQAKILLYEISMINSEIQHDTLIYVMPDSFICRSNFFFDYNDSENFGSNSNAKYRYLGCQEQFSEIANTNSLTSENIYSNIVRSFRQRNSNDDGTPRYYTVPFENQVQSDAGRPYGYISTSYSISRDENISSVIVRGVVDEDKKLTTIWTQMGNSALGVPIPLWAIGSIPNEVSGENNFTSSAPLCTASNSLRDRLYSYPNIVNGSSYNDSYIDSYQLKNFDNQGIWDLIPDFFAETESQLNSWMSTPINTSAIEAYQNNIATFALNDLDNISRIKPPVISQFEVTDIQINNAENHEIILYDNSLHCPIFWEWSIPGTDALSNNQNSILQYNDNFHGTFIIKLEVNDYDGNFNSHYKAIGCVDSTASNYNSGYNIYEYNGICKFNQETSNDINFDEVVNVLDINVLISKILYVYTFINSYDQNNDLNSDGIVNVSDIIFLVDIIINQ